MPDRLSLTDASFLVQGGGAPPLQLGGVGIFAPGLGFADVLAVVERRLDRVPLARRRVQLAPPGAGRPVWVDDADFDLSYHLRHAALPAPGDRGQLGQFVARLIARPLDRGRPLWELYVIEGVEGGRTALFSKVHVAMAGGDGGDPFGVILDDAADPDPGETPVGRWEPTPGPRQVELAVDAVRERVVAAARLGTAVGSAARRLPRDPRRAAGLALSAAGAAANVVARVAMPPPASPLNRPLSEHRRFATARLALDDLRDVHRAVGSTVNDVVVAVTADAVGRLLRWRGHDTKDLDLRVMVPVRVDAATSDESGVVAARAVGEGVVGVVAPLPVLQMDPVARLYRVMGEMAGLKESRQAVAADTLIRLAGYAPANLHARAARVAAAEQRYHVALSNAPGPQSPRYLAGVELEETYPFIPLAGTSALSVAVTSYRGSVFVGLVGDRDAMPDLELLAELDVEALAARRAAVGAA